MRRGATGASARTAATRTADDATPYSSPCGPRARAWIVVVPGRPARTVAPVSAATVESSVQKLTWRVGVGVG